MQPLSNHLPTVLAPKTIDNDLGLNYRTEPDEWDRVPCEERAGYSYVRKPARVRFDREQMVNYVTPGFATAVFVTAWGVQRIRTTAESHRRIAIIEVMGRLSGFIAWGLLGGQPDIILISPEQPSTSIGWCTACKGLRAPKNVVIVCAKDRERCRRSSGESVSTADPAGNVMLSGAADAAGNLIERFGDAFF